MPSRGAVIFTALAFSFAGAASAQKSGSAAPPSASSTTGNTNGSTNTRQPSSTLPNDSNTPQVILSPGRWS